MNGFDCKGATLRGFYRFLVQTIQKLLVGNQKTRATLPVIIIDFFFFLKTRGNNLKRS